MKKGVIFDLDGTLVNSLASIKISGDEALARYGFGPFSEEEYKIFVGDGAKVLVERCLRASGDEKLEYFDRVYQAYREVFEKYCTYQANPYEGISKLLKALKDRGVKIAVLSNKPHNRSVDVIRTLFGEDCFDIVLGQQEGIARKPSPEGVFYILKEWGFLPEEILYLGDTGTDMQTGKSAGAYTVGALWGFRTQKELEEHHADALIKNPQQLLDYLD